MAPGIAIGPAQVREAGDIPIVEYRLPAAKLAAEVSRFQDAVAQAGRQVDKLKAKAERLHGAAAEELGYLFDAHQQMLSSRRLLEGIESRIIGDRRNAESAVMAELAEIARSFEEMEDPYLRSRGQEVREVGHRILRNLTASGFHSFENLPQDSIVIAEEITPADTALMDPEQVGGFATVLGGAEGHTAIMARSLGLPAVLGIAGLLEAVSSGDQVIVDGGAGLLIVNPTAKRLVHYRKQLRAQARTARSFARLRDVPAVTSDGARVTLQANLELPRELVQATAVGAEGIGLLRTEFLFMNRDDLPSEEEQAEVLSAIVHGLAGKPVTIRTLDVGGEKLATALGAGQASGVNPALGLRAIRFSLQEPRLFETQLRAILRAAAHGPVRVLLPMVSHPDELAAVRKIMARAARSLRARKLPLPDPLPPIGAMIEVPGAALAADALARASDFFAVGTNDLTMYTLAIDRGDEQVAHLYNPLHPAVLRLIQFTVEAALRARIPVSVCGEMAGDPRFTALLLGLGVRDLSMTANALPRVKSRILGVDMPAASRRALAIMDQVDSDRIAALLDDFNADGGD